METGYLIEEGGIITRVAEAAITFATGSEYTPVMAGTANNQVLIASAAATDVIGFVKKPVYGDIAAGDAVSVVTRGIIKAHISTAGVARGDALQVGTPGSELARLTIATGDAHLLYRRVARALEDVSDDLAWIEIRIGA